MKTVKNVLIKVSGDVSDHPKFFKYAIEKAKNNYVLVICGGGTKINKALIKAGFEPRFDEHNCRITETFEERMIMRNELEKEEKRLQDKFVGKGVNVKLPILYADSVLCPINGDDLVRAYRLGFDEISIFTLEKRVADKKKKFEDLQKVEIIGV